MSNRYNLNFFHDLAKSRNGKCLSTEFNNLTDLGTWYCNECGHEWNSKFTNIKEGKWCPHCARIRAGKASRKYTIEDFKKIAKDKNGECLSNSYTTGKDKGRWKCNKCDTIWETSFGNIIRGTWCPTCARLNQRLKIKDIKEIALSRGGRCLSDEYVPGEKLEFECGNGHTWTAHAGAVKRGTWCPHCNLTYLNEEKCRYILELLTKEKFNKTKTLMPNGWEIDGYSKDLQVAFEFNGEQHYTTVSRFFTTEKDLNDIQFRDKEKIKLCTDKGIRLLVIPYYEAYKSESNLFYFIYNWLIKNNIKVYESTYSNSLFSSFYKRFDNLSKIKGLAKENGCECLSNEFIYSRQKMKFKCNRKGHIWETTVAKVRRGYWCPECSKELKKIDKKHKATLKKIDPDTEHSINRLNLVRQVAMDNGGECLSDKYYGTDIALQFKCSEGHIWETSPHSVLGGSWCPKCWGNIKRDFEEIKKKINERNGTCLSTEYKNNHTKLKIQCNACNYIWESDTRCIINRNQWCPKCAGRVPYTIEDMKKIARNKGGECLSESYSSLRNKLIWLCGDCGHTWTATASNIVYYNSWCPICAKKSVQPRRKIDINFVNSLCMPYNVKVLSNVYLNNMTKLDFQCLACGCTWKESFVNLEKKIKAKNYICPSCYKKQKKLDRLSKRNFK